MDLMKKRKIEENGSSLAQTERIAPEDARRILERFSPEQMLDILQNAVARHPDVLDAVRSIADSNPSQRKLFVRGLGWETTSEKLREVFSSYGELEEAVVILDKNTGKSKGYGFVIYRHVDGAILALKEPSKKIDGRVTVTQLASSGSTSTGGGHSHSSTVDVSTRKIYVANVPIDMPSDKLLAHFSQYGEIEEGPLGFDKLTGKSKGFALFVYKSSEGAQSALLEPTKMVDGWQMHCKLAIDGKKGKPGGGQGGPGHGVPQNGPHGDSMGMRMGQAGGYGGPYSGYSGGMPPMGGHHHPMNSMVGPAVPPTNYPGGYGGNSGIAMSQYGYGGYGGGTASVAGQTAAGNGGTFNRMPSSSTGTSPYGISSSSSSFSNQLQGTSPAPRPPSGGMYPAFPPYY